MSEGRCPNCQKLVPANQPLCPFCGALLGQQAPPPQPQMQGYPPQQQQMQPQYAPGPQGGGMPRRAGGMKKKRSTGHRAMVDPNRMVERRSVVRGEVQSESQATTFIVVGVIVLGVIAFGIYLFSAGTVGDGTIPPPPPPGPPGEITPAVNDPLTGRYLPTHHIMPDDFTKLRLLYYTLDPSFTSGGQLTPSEIDEVCNRVTERLTSWETANKDWFRSHEGIYHEWIRLGGRVDIEFRSNQYDFNNPYEVRTYQIGH